MGICRGVKSFTEEITSSWPLARHSYGGDKAAAAFEGRQGGRQDDGTEVDWAELPRGAAASVRARLEDQPSEVDVRFTDEGEESRVSASSTSAGSAPARAPKNAQDPCRRRGLRARQVRPRNRELRGADDDFVRNS
jgi:hypothetical protein